MSRLYYPRTQRGQMARGIAAGVDVGDAPRKIAKLIPTELIAGYAALVSASMIIRWESVRLPVVGLCFLLCWVLTAFYLNKVADPGKPKRNQIAVGTVAFPIWAYLISGNEVLPEYYDVGLATVLAVAFSLVSAVIPMNR